jgi:hypothetical protein
MPRKRTVTLAFAVAVILAGCRTDSDLSRFDQTWPQPIAETTCAAWADDMTVGQRFAAAADLLLSARGEAPGFPSDGQFTFYMSRVTTACAETTPESLVPDIAASVFTDYEVQLSE